MDLRRWLALPVVLALVAPSMTGCGAEEEGEAEPSGRPRRAGAVRNAGERLAQAGAWKLPASVRATGENQNVSYDSPPSWNGGSNCSKNFTKGAAALKAHLLGKYAGISTIGGYACRQNTANAAETSVHGTGRALDIMIPTSGGKADNTVGDEIANWLVVNAENIGVQFIIWDQTKWNASYSNNKDRPYTGPNPHVDHLHVELDLEGADMKTAFFKQGQDAAPDGDAAPVDAKADPPADQPEGGDNAADNTSSAAAQGCGDVTEAGSCEADVLKFCEKGELASASCAQQGRTCGEDQPGSGYMVCKLGADKPAPADDAPPADPSPADKAGGQDNAGPGAPDNADGGGCGNVTYAGRCSQGGLSYCDKGKLVQVDCSAKGLSCELDGYNLYFDCL